MKKTIGQKRSDPSGTEWSPIYCWLSDQRQVGNCLADSDTHRTCRKSQNMGAIGRYNDKDVDNRWQQWFQDTGWVRRHFQYCSMNLHELTQSCWDKEDEGRLVSQCARNVYHRWVKSLLKSCLPRWGIILHSCRAALFWRTWLQTRSRRSGSDSCDGESRGWE